MDNKIKIIFGTDATLHLSYTELEGNSGISKNHCVLLLSRTFSKTPYLKKKLATAHWTLQVLSTQFDQRPTVTLSIHNSVQHDDTACCMGSSVWDERSAYNSQLSLKQSSFHSYSTLPPVKCRCEYMCKCVKWQGTETADQAELVKLGSGQLNVS